MNVDYGEHATAIRALLTAALPGPPQRVFDADEVPKPWPSIFVIVHVSGMTRQFGGRGGGGYGMNPWRNSNQVFGRTADEVRRTLRRIRVALDDQPLEVSDEVFHMTYELDTVPELQDDRWFAYIEFTY